jgi:hypothetical protein
MSRRKRFAARSVVAVFVATILGPPFWYDRFAASMTCFAVATVAVTIVTLVTVAEWCERNWDG